MPSHCEFAVLLVDIQYATLALPGSWVKFPGSWEWGKWGIYKDILTLCSFKYSNLNFVSKKVDRKIRSGLVDIMQWYLGSVTQSKVP